MNEEEKFMRLFGGLFFCVGLLTTVVGIGLLIGFKEIFASLICILMGIIFAAIGGGILLSQIKKSMKRREVNQKGRRYTGKIYGYVEDKSCTMNGGYLMNTKVHYFDEKGIEREAIIPTGFAKGTGDYPIGATIDIIALGSSYTWDKDSVRYERIAREDELMDNKPLDPEKLIMVAVSCPHCGASFTAAKGYVCTCAYCGGAIDN